MNPNLPTQKAGYRLTVIGNSSVPYERTNRFTAHSSKRMIGLIREQEEEQEEKEEKEEGVVL